MLCLLRMFGVLVATIFSSMVPATAASLYGSTVAAAWYCCTAPTEPYRQTEFTSAIAGDLIEYSETAFYWFGQGYVSWNGTMDIQERSILIQSTKNSAGSPPDSFGGMVLTFTNAPTILSVSTNFSSNILPIWVTSTDGTVTINLSNITRTTGSFLLLDITLAPVPELSSAALLLIGCTLIFIHRKMSCRSDA